MHFHYYYSVVSDVHRLRNIGTLQNLVNYVAATKDLALTFGSFEILYQLLDFRIPIKLLMLLIDTLDSVLGWWSSNLMEFDQDQRRYTVILWFKDDCCHKGSERVQFLNYLLQPSNLPIPLMVDKMSAISVLMNRKTKSRLKHIDVRSNIFYLGPKVKQYKFLLRRISRSKIILTFTAP